MQSTSKATLNSPPISNGWISLLNEFVVNNEYKQQSRLQELKEQFTACQYAYLPHLFTDKAFSILKSEVDRLKPFTSAKNYEPNGSGSARVMQTFGGVWLFEESAIFSLIYVHHEIRVLIENIVNSHIYHSVESEDIVGLNCLVNVGNIHGWHLDEGEFILITIFEAPAEGDGGNVELIPHWDDYIQTYDQNCSQSIEDCVAQYRTENQILTRYHAPGDAYLLRGDRVLHRVTPLKRQGDIRSVIGMEYTDRPNSVSKGHVTGLYS